MAESTQEKAIVAAYKTQRRIGGVSITYSRLGSEVNLLALPGSSINQVDGHAQVISEARARDFDILAEELILDGEQITPQRGDIVTEDGVEFTLLATGGAPHWRFIDPYRRIMRVHTKER